MKKISEWLKELPEPYRKLALANYNKQNDNHDDALVHSMLMALWCGFDWRKSNEDYEYWRNVCNRIKCGNLPAKPNKESNLEVQLAKVTKQRDEMVNTLKVAMARAYARGYQHGHEDTVDSSYMIVKQQDVVEVFSDDITQMLLDGGQPEAAAVLASLKGGEG